MLLKVADVAHEEWNSLLECLEKITRQKHSSLIQVSVENGFGQMKYLVQFIFFFGGGSVGRSSGLWGEGERQLIIVRGASVHGYAFMSRNKQSRK